MNQQLIENDKIKSETINNLTKLFGEEQKKTLALTQELESEKNKTLWQRLFKKR